MDGRRQVVSLALPAALRARLEAPARARHPRAACGLQRGRRLGARVDVEQAREARNLAEARDRFELDPADHLAAEEAARALGLAVVGVWHSHPDRPARPSEADRAQAQEGWSYVILSVSAQRALELRSWRFVGAEFVEETLTG